MGIHLFENGTKKYLGWHPDEGADLLATFGRSDLATVTGPPLAGATRKEKVSHDGAGKLVIDTSPSKREAAKAKLLARNPASIQDPIVKEIVEFLQEL